MENRSLLLRSIGEGVVVGAVVITAALVLGFLLPALHHPIGIAVFSVLAGMAWAFRPEERLNRYLVVLLLAALVLSIPLLVSPSLIARFLP